MGTSRPWNWRPTVLKTIKVMLGRPLCGQLQDDCQSWLCSFCMEPLPQSIKALGPGLSESGWRGSWLFDRHLPCALSTLASKIKQTFLSTNLPLFIRFWAAGPWFPLHCQVGLCPFPPQPPPPSLARNAKQARYWCAQLLSHVWLFATPWTVACQAPLSMEFSRQKYWSRLPFLPPGDLPDAGIEPASLVSPASADGFFTTGFFASWEAPYTNTHTHNWLTLLWTWN